MNEELLFLYKNIPLSEKKPLKWALSVIPGLGLSSSTQILVSQGLDPQSSWTNSSQEAQKKILSLFSRQSLPARVGTGNSSEGQLLADALKSYAINCIRNLVRDGGYRGQRHRIGKRVRGQRTRTTGRKNRKQKGFQKLKKEAKRNS